MYFCKKLEKINEMSYFHVKLTNKYTETPEIVIYFNFKIHPKRVGQRFHGPQVEKVEFFSDQYMSHFLRIFIFF